MISWIIENLSTLIVSAVLIAAVSAIIVSMVRGRKKGNPPAAAGAQTAPCVPPVTPAIPLHKIFIPKAQTPRSKCGVSAFAQNQFFSRRDKIHFFMAS